MANELIGNSPSIGVAAALTTLSGNGGAITAGALSLKVASVAQVPADIKAVAGGQARILIDAEVLLIDTSTTGGLTWTILARGVDGTTAASHNDGANVYHVWTAAGIRGAAAYQVGQNAPQAHKASHEPGGSDALTALTDASFAAANKDGADGTASLRTLGVTAGKAVGGDRVGWQGVAKSGAFTAVVGQMNYVTGAQTATLPAAPATDAEVGIVALTGTVTVNRGGTDTLGQYGSTGLTSISVPAGFHVVLKYLAGVWYLVRDSRPVGALTSASAYRNAAMTLAAGTATKIPLDAAADDTYGRFDVATNHRYNVPFAGDYQVDGSVYATMVGAQAVLRADIYLNGALVKHAAQSITPYAGALLGSNAAVRLRCAALDFIELVGATDDASAATVTVGAAYTYLTVVRVA